MTLDDQIGQMLEALTGYQRRMKRFAWLEGVAIIVCAGAICLTAYRALNGPLWLRAVSVALVCLNVWTLRQSIRGLKSMRRALREMSQFRDVLELERLARLQ